MTENSSPANAVRDLLPENADERRMFDQFVETFDTSPLLSIANSLYIQRGVVSRPGASFYEQSTIQYNEIVKADAELRRLRIRVPSREQIAQILFERKPTRHPDGHIPKWCDQPDNIRASYYGDADAILALLNGFVSGNTLANK